jgi:1-acyl-sn-glycerol-3-phosphate acyltransferase
MFPEGTRSLSGRLLKAKAGVGMISAMTSAPVVPVYVEGTNAMGAAFWRKRRLKVSIGRPVMPADFEAAGKDDSERYERITDEVMRRIAGLAEEA